MQRSEQVHAELEKVERALNEMKSANSLQDLEEAWKSYLHRVERTWNRILHHYGKSPKWNGWQADVLKLRRSDPLLSYLKNARGADEHTGEDIVSRDGGGFGIRSSDGGYIKIESLEVGNGIFNLKGSENIVVDFYAPNIQLREVTNRGRNYHPPQIHMGKPIYPLTMLNIADLGLQFYRDFIMKVETVFVK